jgi:cyanophycinase
MSRHALALTLVVASLVAPVAAQEAPPRGHLILIGGGDKPKAVMEKFVELAGGRDAPVVVFPTASTERGTRKYYRKQFGQEYGCTNVTVVDVRTREDALRPEMVSLVEHAGGIFFGGGDQSRITAALLGTPLAAALRAAYLRGAAIGGTSAGTACMSDPMITGEGDFTLLTAANVELKPGLGLLPPTVMVDQHFVARQRENRLISVVLEHPELLGVGVDEETALWVKPDRTFEVLGNGWVVVLDASGAAVQRQPRPGGGTSLGVHGLTTHVLLPGERFDLGTRRLLTGTEP